jgi:hypothetical protein
MLDDKIIFQGLVLHMTNVLNLCAETVHSTEKNKINEISEPSVVI